MQLASTERAVKAPSAAIPRRIGGALVSSVAGVGKWLANAGHKDRPCGRCGTIVRAGQRQCVLCSNSFDI